MQTRNSCLECTIRSTHCCCCCCYFVISYCFLLLFASPLGARICMVRASERIPLFTFYLHIHSIHFGRYLCSVSAGCCCSSCVRYVCCCLLLYFLCKLLLLAIFFPRIHPVDFLRSTALLPFKWKEVTLQNDVRGRLF